MNLPDDFVFTQSSLQDFVDCPRRFELRYLRKWRWPAVMVSAVQEHERRMQMGARFHQLVRQHLRGIPADVLLKHIEDELIRGWWNAYLGSGLLNLPGNRRVEFVLTAPLGDYVLSARYDLLAVEPGARAVIVDWKTTPAVLRREWLVARLQTVVYRYVLASAGGYLNGGQVIEPGQIEMIYWYAESGREVRLPYSGEQLRQDEDYLLRLVEEIGVCAEFPLTEDVFGCRYCVYRSLCDRGRGAGGFEAYGDDEDDGGWEDFRINLDQIGEVAF